MLRYNFHIYVYGERMSSVYLARQPIVNTDEQLTAYEILYLDSQKETVISNDRSASASVINSILNKFGTRKFLTSNKAFIKIDEKFLMSDLIFTIPSDIFILSLFDKIELDSRVIERIEQLHEKGFSLGVNDTNVNEESILKYKNIIDKLEYFKINMNEGISLKDKKFISQLKNEGIKIVATKIEDSEEYQLAQDLRCDLYQGYCFAKPQILENEKFDPSRFNVLKLYNMLLEDTNIDEITSEFENNHALTLQLLQFINSAHFNFRSKISSIHQILTLIGRKPLSQWLMMMIYSKSVTNDNQTPPLILMVRNRTELMQNLLKSVKPDVKSNALGEAYLVGVLSLINAVFHTELSEILDNIHISDIVKKALLHDEGTLGILYKLVRDVEAFNISSIVDFSKKYNIKEEDIQELILKSIEDVNEFENSMKAS